MSPEIEAEYKAALRNLLTKALPLLPEDQRSSYMSTDYGKAKHILGYWRSKEDPCEWVIPPGTEVREVDHYEFAGTDASSNLVTSLEAEGINCKCGLLTNETIRADATFSEVLEQVVGAPTDHTETL